MVVVKASWFKEFNGLFVAVGAVLLLVGCGADIGENTVPSQLVSGDTEQVGGLEKLEHPLSIEYLRKQEFPGSELVVEQELNPGSNFERFIVSYKSEGLKQFALMTVPSGVAPEDGWPAIVFNHGYIPPQQYRTTERYVEYVNGFARNGYVVLRPDYRGHGNSEGVASGGYGSNDYTIDVLNALASLKRDTRVNAEKIGMWGHSMGGHITLRSMVTDPSIKAGVIWAGVVGSYQDYQELWWNRRARLTPTGTPKPGERGYWRYKMIEDNGSFSENPEFWESISATSYLGDMGGPVQLHHGTADSSVPAVMSEKTYERLKGISPESEVYIYEGDDHNLSVNFGVAMRRSVEFFDRYLK